jgi:HEAT repeat protein
LLGKIALGEIEGVSCYERTNAIYVLGMMKDPAAVPWLTTLLCHSDLDLQILAVRALGRIGGDQALEPVRRMYNGPRRGLEQGTNGETKHFAADSLAEALTTPIPPALALEMRDVLGQPLAAANEHLARKQAPRAAIPDPAQAAFRSRSARS